MIRLHYFPSNASLTPHLVLRELGVPFELVQVDRTQGAHKSAAYLKLNPNGLIPVLEDGGLVLYETAAIVLHLCDTHPQAGLAPAVGTAERATFYKWLLWLSNTVQAAMPLYFYSDRYVAAGNAAGAAEVKAQTEARLAGLFDQLEAHFAANSAANSAESAAANSAENPAAQAGPWMLGQHFSALDPYVFMLCRWTRGMQRPARTLPHLGAFLQRMLARPAVQATIAAEGLVPPLV